jgi:hypothetical protein
VTERVTGDDAVTCAICQHESSIAMIAVHLEREHGIDPADIANAPVVYDGFFDDEDDER